MDARQLIAKQWNSTEHQLRGDSSPMDASGTGDRAHTAVSEEGARADICLCFSKSQTHHLLGNRFLKACAPP